MSCAVKTSGVIESFIQCVTVMSKMNIIVEIEHKYESVLKG